jgi:hypothetical protein
MAYEEDGIILPRIYDGPYNPKAETHLFRGELLLEVIERIRKPHGTNNVLEIGAGARTSHLICPYEPYLIAAAMEGCGYAMGIVDSDPNIISDLMRRESVIYVPNALGTSEDDIAERVWEKYMSLLGEEWQFADVDDPDLIFRGDREAESLQAYPIHVAPVPGSFRDGLNDGRIQLYESDIREFDWDLVADGSLTLTVILNVLPYIREREQRTILEALAYKLEPGGKILINGFIKPYRFMSQVFRSFTGGWIDPNSLNAIGLQITPEDMLVDDKVQMIWVLSRLGD